MSYKVILIFLDLLVQTSRRSAAVKKTADISGDSDRLGNCRRRSLSEDIAGSIFLRVEMRAWPVLALYWQVRSASCSVSGQELLHKVQRGEVAGVIW